VRFADVVSASTPFSWRLNIEANRTRLVLVGEVDIAAHEDLLAAVAAVPARPVPLVVELGAVTFLDGSGISALMSLTQAAVDRGFTIGFTDRPPVVERVLDLTDTTLASLREGATTAEA
jgi:anti-anti-sigma factor